MSAASDLSLVTERDESLQAFKAFKLAFAAGADPFRRVVGFQGGSRRVDVLWHGPPAGIWGLFVSKPQDHQSEKPLDRFWNCFGVADPNQHSSSLSDSGNQDQLTD